MTMTRGERQTWLELRRLVRQARAGKWPSCPRCKGPRDAGRGRYCRACRAAYMRAWRARGARETPDVSRGTMSAGA